MLKKIIIFSFLLIFPLSGQAVGNGLDARASIWKESFKKANVEKIRENRNYFYFSEQELNDLFIQEIVHEKDPLARDFNISLEDGSFKLQVFLLKVLKGRVYLEGRPKKDGFGIEVSKAKYYFIRIPSRWVEKEINREIEKYFSFLTESPEYQGGRIVIEDQSARLLLDFK